MSVLQFALLGVGLGAIFGLFGSAVVVTYKGSGVLNFAVGAIGMVGAYVCFELSASKGISLLIAIPIGVLVAAVLGILFQLIVMRRLRTSAVTTKVVATLGLMAVLTAVADLLWEPNGGALGIPPFLPTGTVAPFGGSGVGIDRLCIFGIALAITILLAVAQKRTRIGLATSAVAEGSVVPTLMGWSPARIGAISWGVGSATAAVAAILVGDISGLDVNTVTLLVLPALAAALVGGFESLFLAFAGGMAIGIGESLVGSYVQTPGWATAVPLLVIVAIMVARGSTLPGKSEVGVRLPRVTPGRLGPWSLFFLIAAAVYISIASSIWLGAIALSLIFGLIALSLVVVTGFGGQISLAQFALAGIGAYFTVMFNISVHLPIGLAIIFGTLATIPVGLIVAVPAIRTRGSNLAVATLALATVVSDLVLQQASASTAIATHDLGALSFFGISFSPITHLRNFAFLSLGLFSVAALLTANFRRSSVGTRLLAVRSNERAAASLGISVPGMKILAFGLAAVFAALAGGLIETQFLVGDFSQFTVPASVSVVLNSVVGGIGWVSGAAVAGGSADAGIVSQLLSQWIDPSLWLAMAIGVSVLLVVVFQPNGIAPFNIDAYKTASAKLRFLRRRSSRSNVARVSRQMVSSKAEDLLAAGGRSETVTVEVLDLSVQFGDQLALDAVSICISPGEILGLIGANGAGKSTLIDAVSGFQRPSGGSVLVDGVPIGKTSPARLAKQGIVRSFQSVELFEDLSVWENIDVATDVGGTLRRIADMLLPGRFAGHGRTARAVKQFHLEDLISRYPAELDHATRRLVAVARAFAASPGVLLLDEPAAGLDVSERGELALQIRQMVEALGVGVLLVEHDVDFVFGLCDRVIALETGQVIASGTPAEVRHAPQVVAAYLGSEARSATEPA